MQLLIGLIVVAGIAYVWAEALVLPSFEKRQQQTEDIQQYEQTISEFEAAAKAVLDSASSSASSSATVPSTGTPAKPTTPAKQATTTFQGPTGQPKIKGPTGPPPNY